MDHLLFPFCLTWFGHIAIGWDGAELLGDICLPWPLLGQLSSRYREGTVQWPQKVVVAGFGQGKRWREMREDWLMLLCMTAFCIFCWFALRKLIGTSWLFLFNCLICITASFLQEYVSEHWMKNVGDMCQFHFSQPMAPGWCEHVSGVPWLYYSTAPCVWLVKSSASDAGMLGKFEFKILTSS